MQAMETTDSTVEAMEKAFSQMPSEIVGLLLSVTEPEAITWSRINMPMFIGFAPHGAYLASTPLAFPEDAGEPTLLPICSAGMVYADHYTVKPYDNKPGKVASIDAKLFHEAYTKVCEAIKEKPMKLSQLVEIVKPMFEPADCQQNASLLYSIFYSLNKQGLLNVQEVRVPGARDDLDAPELRVSLK